MPLDSHESLQRVQEGDTLALNDFKGLCRSIYKECFPSLLRDAEDLTHDIYIKIKELNDKDLAKIEYPSSWLYRVVWNHCSDKIDKQKRNELCDPHKLDELFDGAKRAEDYPPAADVCIEHIAEEYRKKTIRNAIERLPKELDRIIITIGLEEKLKDKEILEELKRLHYQGIIKKVPPSEGAITTKRSRLRADLRKIILEENDLEEIKANLRSLELPPPVEQEIMRRIPKEIMRQIPNGSLNSAPTPSKPLGPWIIGDSIAIGFALLIGPGIGQPIAFQPPDSPNALEWVGRVEPVDAPVVKKSSSKLSQINQARGSGEGESENGNQENDSVQKTAADSQNNTTSDNIDWTQVGGPDGGMVKALHTTPEGTLFAGTVTGGIFCSTDGGETWAPASEGLRVSPNNGPPDIIVLTQEGNTLYAGTGSDLFYSTNGGDSWQQVTHFRGDRRISGIAIIDDTVYIGHKQSVFFSNDNGESWTLIDKGLTGQGEPRLSVSGMTLFAQMERHVFHLKAGEKSWTKLAVVDPSQKKVVDSDITKFAISGETIYAATADGDLFRSTNMGSSWKSIKPKGMQGFDGKLAALGNMVFYIGSNSANGRVFRSTNSGNSWTMLNTNLTNQAILSTEVLSEKTLYVGTFKGVFRSTDGGESWIKTSTGIINTWIRKLVFVKNVLYALTFDSIVKSADGGNSWVPVNEELIASDVATLAVSGEELYVATDSRIYRLAEDGNSWLPIQTNMQSSNGRISVVSQLVFNEDTFYIVAGRERLYRWRMGEDLWTDLGLEVSYLTDLAVSDRTVYVGSDDGKLFCSFDEGETWTDVSQNLPNPTQETGFSDLVFVGETIYARSRDRVFRSRDGGETWTSINTGLPDGYIDMQLVDGTTLYGTNSHGIFRLTHESDSWERIAPTHHQVMALAFDGTTFYAGTLRQGVYRLSLEE